MIKKRIIIEDGNLESAFDKIRSYFKEYHPAGYSTSAHLSVGGEGLIVDFERFESCD